MDHLGQVPGDGAVEVRASQKRITRSRHDLESPVFDSHDGDVEGSSAQVDHRHLAIELGEPVGQGRGGGFADDANGLQSGDGGCVAHGLPLGFVEEGGNGDDGSVEPRR